MRVIDPGTIPPPSTKSNSLRPVRQRSSGWAATSRSRVAGKSVRRYDGSPLPSCLPPFRPTDLPAGSSATEFHAAHASHLPTHLGCSWPHSVQRYTDLGLGMADGRWDG